MKTIEHLFKILCSNCSNKRLLIHGKLFFDTLIKNDEKTYEQVIEMGRKNDYTTGNLLDYEYFLKHYKLITIDSSK